MRLADIINGPWAISPSMLAEIHQIYGRHLRGEKIDVNALEETLGMPLKNEHKGYTVDDGVAIMHLDGVIAKKMNIFSRVSGGISSELAARDFQEALDDREVKAIVMSMDSPGGTVDGTPEFAELIYKSRGIKPIFGHSTGGILSAMYWIGSAVDEIYISSEVVQIGSIGVLAKHVDSSEADAAQGRKVTEISAGKYKRIASEHKPLTEEGEKDIQEKVDYIYSAFVDDVAKHRGVSVDDVLNNMADGQTYFGTQTITNGLVDGMATLDETIEKARAAAQGGIASSAAGDVAAGKISGAGGAPQHNKEVPMLDLAAFKKDNDEMYKAIVAEVQGDMTLKIKTARQEGKVEGVAEGADAECKRVIAVKAQSIPGHEALVETMVADGKTTGPEAAQQIILAENKARGTAADDIDAEGNKIVVAVIDDSKAKKKVDGARVTDATIKADWDADADAQDEFLDNFDAYAAFRKADANGQIKLRSVQA